MTTYTPPAEGTTEPRVRWCDRDDAHPAHERRNQFGGKDYCTGMSEEAAARGRPSPPAPAAVTAYDIDAWLADTEATDEQRAAIQRAADRIAARWPDPDLADTREQALIGAAQIILGDAALDEIGSAYVAARAVEQEAHAALTGALIASEGTASEYDLADRAGVTRVTVRKALGKGV